MLMGLSMGLFPGSTGTGEGACVDGCRAGRCLGRLWALDRVIRYGSFPYLYIHRRLIALLLEGQVITFPLDAVEAMDPPGDR